MHTIIADDQTVVGSLTLSASMTSYSALPVVYNLATRYNPTEPRQRSGDTAAHLTKLGGKEGQRHSRAGATGVAAGKPAAVHQPPQTPQLVTLALALHERHTVPQRAGDSVKRLD